MAKGAHRGHRPLVRGNALSRGPRFAVLAGVAAVAAALAVLMFTGCPKFAEGADGAGKDAPAGEKKTPPPLFVEPTELSTQQDRRCEDCHLDVAINTYDLPHMETGVGCSACHGPSVKHTVVEDNSVKADHTWKDDRGKIPEACGECHADAAKMKPYKLPADQLAQLTKSAHGPAEGKAGFRAVCSDCHGAPMASEAVAGDRKIWNHEVRAPSDPKGSVYPVNVPATCNRCHGDEKLMKEHKLPADAYALFVKSPHGRKLLGDDSPRRERRQEDGRRREARRRRDDRGPSCATCHGSHETRTWAEVEKECGTCHAGMEFHFADHKKPAEVKVRCTACHGHHEVFTKDIPKDVKP